MLAEPGDTMKELIKEWLEGARQARDPGPVVRVTTARNGRDLRWDFDVTDGTDLGELAKRISNSCEDSGLSGKYDLCALDAQGRVVATASHQVVLPSPALVSNGTSTEEIVSTAMRERYPYVNLGFRAMVEALRHAHKYIGELQKENAALRTECLKLREQQVGSGAREAKPRSRKRRANAVQSHE
jgi:hypothetical protein